MASQLTFEHKLYFDNGYQNIILSRWTAKHQEDLWIRKTPLRETVMKILEVIEELEIGDVRFCRLLTICRNFFPSYRTRGSHHIFSTPWEGDPRINVQPDKGGKSKSYQVKQVLNALQKLLEVQQEEDEE